MTCGSHCSGWSAEGLALEQLNIPHRHLFACDTDPAVLKLLKRSFNIGHIFRDSNDPATIAASPAVDFYVCGFPCQPFSAAGRNHGLADSRTNVIASLLQYLRSKPPKCFCLENVSNLGRMHAEVLHNILAVLHGIVDNRGRPVFVLSYKTLDTADFGLPQRRRRIYIVGMRTDCYGTAHGNPEFAWPPAAACPAIAAFLATDCPQETDSSSTLIHTATLERNLGKGFAKLASRFRGGLPDAIIDVGAGPNRSCMGIGVCPTITAGRAAAHGYFWTTRGRTLTTSEMARLQGVDLERFQDAGLTDQQLGRLIGNAMSVPVVVQLLRSMLPAVGLTHAWPVVDPPPAAASPAPAAVAACPTHVAACPTLTAAACPARSVLRRPAAAL